MNNLPNGKHVQRLAYIALTEKLRCALFITELISFTNALELSIIIYLLSK